MKHIKFRSFSLIALSLLSAACQNSSQVAAVQLQNPNAATTETANLKVSFSSLHLEMKSDFHVVADPQFFADANTNDAINDKMASALDIGPNGTVALGTRSTSTSTFSGQHAKATETNSLAFTFRKAAGLDIAQVILQRTDTSDQVVFSDEDFAETCPAAQSVCEIIWPLAAGETFVRGGSTQNGDGSTGSSIEIEPASYEFVVQTANADVPAYVFPLRFQQRPTVMTSSSFVLFGGVESSTMVSNNVRTSSAGNYFAIDLNEARTQLNGTEFTQSFNSDRFAKIAMNSEAILSVFVLWRDSGVMSDVVITAPNGHRVVDFTGVASACDSECQFPIAGQVFDVTATNVSAAEHREVLAQGQYKIEYTLKATGKKVMKTFDIKSSESASIYSLF